MTGLGKRLFSAELVPKQTLSKSLRLRYLEEHQFPLKNAHTEAHHFFRLHASDERKRVQVPHGYEVCTYFDLGILLLERLT